MVAIDPPTSAVVIFGDENDEIVKLLNTSASQFLSLETKYYSASVQIFKSKDSTDPASKITDLPINGVIFNNSFQQAQEISENFEPFNESDVRLFCTKVEPTKEMHQWAIANQVEIVDIEEEPERVLQALESSIWPGANMKSGNPYVASGRPIETTSEHDSSASNQQNSQNDLLEMLEAEDDFNDILGLVEQTRSAGQNLSDEQRRANAERVISAISNMLGSDLLLDDE